MQIAIVLLVLVNLLVLVWSNFQETGSSREFQQPDTGNLRLLTGHTANATPAVQKVVQAQPVAEQQLEQASALVQPPPAADISLMPNPQQPPAEPVQLAQNEPEQDEPSAEQWATQAQAMVSDTTEQKKDDIASFNYQPPQNEVVHEKQPTADLNKLPPLDKPAEPVAAMPRQQPDFPEPELSDPLPPPPAQKSVPVQPARPDAAQLTETLCWQVGPYISQAAAQKAAQKRPESSNPRHIKQEIETIHLGYIVLVPAKNGLEGANQTVKQLRHKQVRDFQIMKKGPFRHAVSLGVFKEKANAIDWVETMHKKGLGQVVMRDRFKETHRYWLELDGKAIMHSPDVLQSAYPGLSIKRADCNQSGN